MFYKNTKKKCIYFFIKSRQKKCILFPAQDCSTAPYTTNDEGLPSALLDYDGVMDFFQEEFGFDANETVALMGAHTLGAANPDNSGFNGVWVEGEPQYFNNEYYQVRSSCQVF